MYASKPVRAVMDIKVSSDLNSLDQAEQALHYLLVSMEKTRAHYPRLFSQVNDTPQMQQTRIDSMKVMSECVPGDSLSDQRYAFALTAWMDNQPDDSPGSILSVMGLASVLVSILKEKQKRGLRFWSIFLQFQAEMFLLKRNLRFYFH